MRVLLLHNRYRLPGGEDTVVDSEINLLRSRGIEVLHLDAHNEVDSRVELQGAFGLALNSHWSRESYEGVRKICREFRPDIAHAHNTWMRLTPAVHAACRDEGVATVQTLHNFRLFCTNAQFERDGHRCEDCLGRSPWRGVVRRCYRNSFVASAAVARMITTNRVRKTWQERVNAFIALSHHARKLYIAGGIPASRIHIKANFVDDRGMPRTLPSRSREFVFVGRLVAQKGINTLMDAWALSGIGNEARLLIVGDGPEKAALEAYANKIGIASQVSFTGYQTQANVHAYLSSARAMVIPSRFYECFPRTLVEAMSAGRPVIASNVSSLNELVTPNIGLQFPAEDASTLASCLRRMYDDKALADDLGSEARATFLARYTPERNFDALMQIYEIAMSRQEAWLGAEPVAAGGVGMIAPRQSVLGIGITPTSYEQVCRQCVQWVEERRSEPDATRARYVCFADVRSVMTARSDEHFRRVLNQSDITTPDGMPVAWAMRSFGQESQDRVYGPTLMLDLCEQAARRGYRVFFYGARYETLETLSKNLLARFPKLEIAGMYAPPFRPLTATEDREVTARIQASGAELLFVGMSAPKQETWMSQHVENLPGVVMLGVGAAFDFHAGCVRQAPGWMQRNGLEWFHRLWMEPRRLWRRYLLQTPMFLPLWFLQFAGLMRFPGAYLPDGDGVRTRNR